MPELGLEAPTILLILLPGFLCARVNQALCVRPQQTELDKVVEALLYSFLIYVAFAALSGTMPISFRVEPDGGAKRYSVDAKLKPLLLLTGLAFGLALLTSYATTSDIYGRVFRRLGITQRTTRSSIWSDAFHEITGYVQVELMDGRNVLGWVRYYSDTPEESSLFLEDAAWVTAEQEMVRIDGPGILLTKELGIRSVMFLRPAEVQPHEGKH